LWPPARARRSLQAPPRLSQPRSRHWNRPRNSIAQTGWKLCSSSSWRGRWLCFFFFVFVVGSIFQKKKKIHYALTRSYTLFSRCQKYPSDEYACKKNEKKKTKYMMRVSSHGACGCGSGVVLGSLGVAQDTRACEACRADPIVAAAVGGRVVDMGLTLDEALARWSVARTLCVFFLFRLLVFSPCWHSRSSTRYSRSCSVFFAKKKKKKKKL
jgi:hypothetical protein